MPISLTPRRAYLKSRELVGLPPLPEEQLGLKGPDPIDVSDWVREPADDRLMPINLLDEYPVPVLDQGRTNRCGPHAGVSGMSILMQKASADRTQMSVNDLYRFSRVHTNVDGGVYMRDLMQGMMTRGALPESYWPNSMRFDAIPKGLKDGGDLDPIRFRIRGGYWRVKTAMDAAHIVAGERVPIWVGCMLYKEVTRKANFDGIFRMPERNDTEIGGHAMLIVGTVYMSGKLYFILLNSWGSRVGRGGLFLMPEEYISEHICYDLWTVAKDIF